jgi:predicted MPP superfamily phosphohydrolase
MKFKYAKYIKYALLGLLGLSATYLTWGVAIEPYLIDREEYVAEIPNLPPAWEGKKVGLISDMQVGMWLGNTSTIRRIVNQLVEERPAVVLIAGDFIYEPGKNPSQELNKVTALVRPLPEAGIPTYAVLGNHDYRLKDSKTTSQDEKLSTQVRQALEAAGVQVLKNEAVGLELPGKPVKRTPEENSKSSYPVCTAGCDRSKGNRAGTKTNETLYLVGIGAHIPKQDKPNVALAQVPEAAPRLVMMHNPNSFDALPPNTAPLAVAGHTHGGQINLLPFGLTPVWFLLTYDEEELVHVAGWIEDFGKPGNHLYVNRGIGFSRVPIRINAPPELTLFTLGKTTESASR